MIFDWKRECPEEFGRRFPPVAGEGRGQIVEPFVCVRCGRESWRSFSWAHRPLNSDIRTCGGTVVPRSQVEETRRREAKERATFMLQVARQEAGHLPPPVGGGGGLWAG